MKELISQSRPSDERKSKVGTDFLEHWFYKQRCQNYKIITDKEQQVQGLDVIFDFNNLTYKSDEKAATDYINNSYPLSSFCLELSSYDRYGYNLRYGWFLDLTTQKNDSYIFLWIDTADSEELKNADEIQTAEMALVRKESLWKYIMNIFNLRDVNDAYNFLKGTNDNIRQQQIVPIRNLSEDGYKFSFSDQKPEKPINLLIPRKELVKMADFTKNIKEIK